MSQLAVNRVALQMHDELRTLTVGLGAIAGAEVQPHLAKILTELQTVNQLLKLDFAPAASSPTKRNSKRTHRTKPGNFNATD